MTTSNTSLVSPRPRRKSRRRRSLGALQGQHDSRCHSRSALDTREAPSRRRSGSARKQGECNQALARIGCRAKEQRSRALCQGVLGAQGGGRTHSQRLSSERPAIEAARQHHEGYHPRQRPARAHA